MQSAAEGWETCTSKTISNTHLYAPKLNRYRSQCHVVDDGPAAEEDEDDARRGGSPRRA